MHEEIFIFISLFALVFGYVFLRSRENMALIEKGINPRRKQTGPRPYTYMKYALFLIGAGTGLAIAFGLDLHFFRDITHDNPAIYFALIAVGGGIGLFTAYKIERKDMGGKDDTE